MVLLHDSITSRAIDRFARIHRNGYYRWLATLIDVSLIKDRQTLVKTLKDIRFKLETSTFPGYVMLKANELP